MVHTVLNNREEGFGGMRLLVHLTHLPTNRNEITNLCPLLAKIKQIKKRDFVNYLILRQSRDFVNFMIFWQSRDFFNYILFWQSWDFVSYVIFRQSSKTWNAGGLNLSVVSKGHQEGERGIAPKAEKYSWSWKERWSTSQFQRNLPCFTDFKKDPKLFFNHLIEHSLSTKAVSNTYQSNIID